MKKKIKLETKRLICLLILVASILTIVGTISYAYFTTAGEHKPVGADLGTATLALRFADNDNGINANMKFGETVTKKFLIENTGTAEASLSLDWKNLINTYMNGSLTYNMTYSETENGEYKELLPSSNVPVSSNPLRQTMAGEISVPAGETYYYNLNITLNSTDVDQSSDLEAVLNTMFDVGQPLKYRYYTLSVNPNGGVWDEFSSTQEYLLKNGETKTINTPTRTGYTFDGWTLTGVSSTLEDGLFKMGISDASLEASWIPNRYKVTIDGTEREVAYGESIDLGTPSKEGYTFTNWESTGGTIENNTLTVTDVKDIVVTSKYVINNYKYIVYHNKMNINGVGYTRVEADTDEGESEYNSTVTPDVKTYTGFDSPSQESITIKHETVYPPVLNKVEYNYDRHQHTLTIEPNGGTYTGQTTSTMYYEATVTLIPPTKTGYNFTNWTASTGTLNGNEFTMGDEDSTVTANYEAKTFSVTFNANGGTTPTASKTVTYDSTYGELPTPTYEGYEFLGWFTAQENGTEVKDTTKVTLSDNQTLYAHWKVKLITLANGLKANLPTVTNYEDGEKTEMYVFDHDELTTTTTDSNATTHSATQVMDWTSEERRDYRYIGANPNNYITFNDETWRIIGVFTVENESGNKEQLIKIIRNESIGNISWDDYTDGSESNEWSTASLQGLLNGEYYNTEGSFNYTFKTFSTSTGTTVTIPKGLNAIARSQIAKVKWYLGGSRAFQNLGGPDYYNFERGAKTCATETTRCSEGRTTSIVQNVGIMYPSDYVYTYANGVDDTCYTDGYNCRYSNANAGWLFNDAEQWTISPTADIKFYAFFVRNSYVGRDDACFTYGVRPVVFLNSKIAIVDGDGSQGNPYTLG